MGYVVHLYEVPRIYSPGPFRALSEIFLRRRKMVAFAAVKIFVSHMFGFPQFQFVPFRLSIWAYRDVARERLVLRTNFKLLLTRLSE